MKAAVESELTIATSYTVDVILTTSLPFVFAKLSEQLDFHILMNLS